MSKYFFDYLPLWATYLSVVLVIVASIYAGIRYAHWRKNHIDIEDESPINTLVGATLGLLAFMLAFTFGLTSSRFEAKKHFQLEELNSIETAWLRTSLVNEPYSSNIKNALKDYVEIRINIVEHPESLNTAIQDAQAIQSDIWQQLTALSKEVNGNDRINALLIDSINTMFDNQSRRISVGLIDKIPSAIWAALFILILISMFEVGYLLGRMKKSNWVLIMALSLSFSAVVIIIVDLDSLKGHIQLNHQQLYTLYQKIQ